MKVATVLPWVGAIVFGALAPAVILVTLAQEIRLLPLTFSVTLGHSLILGLPTAILYRAKRWTRFAAAIAGGFVIGAIPGGIFAWPVSLSMRTTGSVDGVPTIINGIPTLAGWLQYLGFVGTLGALGAIGAVVFRLIIKRSGAFETIERNSEAPPVMRTRFATMIASAAIVAAAAVAAIPSIMEDRSCHNMLRDGRASIRPKVSIDLKIDPDDWPKVTTLLAQVSASHAMSFRNLNREEAGVVEMLMLSACSEQGPAIDIVSHRSLFRRLAAQMPDRGLPIGIYDLSDGETWQALARDLIAAFESQWPGKIRFVNGKGEFIPESSVLAPPSGAPSVR